MRRARPAARVVEIPAGAAAASALPAFEAGETVVVMGLCGALRGLHAGDVVVYRQVVRTAPTSAGGAAGALALDEGLAGALTHAVPGASVVRACTAEQVVTTAAARARLAERFDSDVVDMEGAHLATALAARGVRFAMVRVVSDDASRDLPPLDDAIDARGRVRPLRIALAFARAPIAAFEFVRNVRRALATLTGTARALTARPV